MRSRARHDGGVAENLHERIARRLAAWLNLERRSFATILFENRCRLLRRRDDILYGDCAYLPQAASDCSASLAGGRPQYDVAASGTSLPTMAYVWRRHAA